ncbi:protein adenylyltransferase SelO [Epibacterium ulvae]|uniref:protein adenylyltransferase SelO n=1 Tax=Epibacterium ulvae TaxID=1156985 RepID=UPI002490C930|nr:YdiU family protein [Epibacterium ulvae]
MTVSIPFDNTFAQLPDVFYTKQSPVAVKAPHLLAFNSELADELNITADRKDALADVFSGNALPDGADPLAQLYSGHQFGNYNPQLGDGRAILLGEVIDQDGQRRDIQLKGAGRTPYSRGGDGRAWLGPVLREFVVSEAMHALGIPTTRALAAVTTGETVWRESGFPGAVLTRVAKSHLRVGTFQIYAARDQIDALKQLTQYAIARHYPEAKGAMGLLRAVRDAQVELIAGWLSVGFIHGVMNTDNSSIAGETIDYGPCAFMDDYHPQQVFSSIDRMGRYAYSNQPDIGVWNLAQLATALIQQYEDPESVLEEATEIVHSMPGLLDDARLRRFAAKIGISQCQDGDADLVRDLLQQMSDEKCDFTNTFSDLSKGNVSDKISKDWQARWRQRLLSEPDAHRVMKLANPVFIARNHLVEQMISSALEGDLSPFNRLMTALRHPYEDQPEFADLQKPPEPEQRVQATFCGT